jgi:uncharacterized protein (TIGR02145 family)
MKTRIINSSSGRHAHLAAATDRQYPALAALLISCALLLPAQLFSQTEPSALFEVQSTDKGLLLPRMTGAQRDGITNPAAGLMIYNTSTGCLEINQGSPSAPLWRPADCRGTVDALTCAGAVVAGSLLSNQPATGVVVSIPYSGGNGGGHNGQTAVSEGVTGLTATLAPGKFATGSGHLMYLLSGTPATAGTATFNLNAGGKSCALELTVPAPGSISALQCGNAVVTGTLVAYHTIAGISAGIPYSGGNGGAYAGQTVASAGVTGLTATLAAGHFGNGAGVLNLSLSGTATAAGTATFSLNIGGQECSLELTVLGGTGCYARTGASTYKNFMCHNLASANTSAHPFTPGWEINGGYWQWGRKGPEPSDWLDTNTPHFAHGPTGFNFITSNGSGSNNWSAEIVPGSSWLDNTKTAHDPCPEGYRLPSKTQWDEVLQHNTLSAVGTWSNSEVNYSSGIFVGPDLLLPATGARNQMSGDLSFRGALGSYWSSTEDEYDQAFSLSFFGGEPMSVGTGVSHRNSGNAVRCLAENSAFFSGSVASLSCGGAALSGILAAGLPASGVSASITYSGGNGGQYNGQSVASTGVTGLAATLMAGSFANGAGSLSLAISGTAMSAGTASFALTIGGQSCNVTLAVALPATGSITFLDCGSATASGFLAAFHTTTGILISVPYTGGNAGTHYGQTVSSAGVPGLTATLAPGSFTIGNGVLNYLVTGTATAEGTASFSLSIGGQSCTLSLPVTAGSGCYARVSGSSYKNFMCHNLASANTAADPFQPTWEIHGGYWQWGRKGTSPSSWLNTNTANFAHGPVGPGTGEANQAAISNWSQMAAPDGAWSDATKTASDPCPLGYRVPTKAQWEGLVLNNMESYTSASWSPGFTNYSVGRFYGSALMLPVAGLRSPGSGELVYRAESCHYWSSSQSGILAWSLYNQELNGVTRNHGLSVRCIAHDAAFTYGVISNLQCDNATLSGMLVSGLAASGVSADVPYTGGNGGIYSGQTVASTGVTGLTATLEAGIFASGAGSVTYQISGTPAGAGTADFELFLEGQSCTLSLPVADGAISTLNCAGATQTGTLVSGVAASGVSMQVPYTGGNGGPYGGQTVTSIGISGLTATLEAGIFATGAGSVIYEISGIPVGAGTAGFELSIGGQSCTLSMTVEDGAISTLNCAGATQTGNLVSGVATSGVSVQVPYTGGNGGSHGGQVVNSTGLSGLTATLTAGNFASGADSVTYEISGTPAAAGAASFALSIGGQSCTLELTVAPGMIGALNCGAAVQTGRLMPAQAAAGVSVSVPYTGGNGGVHNGQVIASAGVTGLTATLAQGIFAVDTGTLTYIISGIPSAAGQASFALNIGGQSCTLLMPVGCGAYLAPGQWKVFMCHNLASANTAADPFAPSWEINGGYWQWGRPGQAAPGPSGPGSTQANAGAISGWNTTNAPNGSWQDGTKTGNDPCPNGYRVPTKAQWDAVLNVSYNPQSIVGTWSTTINNPTNYTAGRFFGPALMLPAAGYRYDADGALFNRGYYGYYWSSTENGSDGAWLLYFYSGTAYAYSYYRRFGFSVRCAAE